MKRRSRQGRELVAARQFGAVPDSGENASQALQSALARCKENGPSRLVLEPGRYELGQIREQATIGAPCIRVDGAVDLEIDGQGAELVGRDLSTLFQFTGARNLAIRNLTVDWEPCPFTGGVVVATGEGSFDLKVEPPHPALAGVIIQGVLGYDPIHHRMAHRGLDYYQRGGECLTPTQIVGDGVIRVFVSRDRGIPAVGDPVIARHQIYSCNPFHLVSCADVEVTDLTVYAAPGMGLVGADSENISLERFNVLRRPDSGRWMSTGADATHFMSCRGTISITDCLFEGMGDDATNIHNRNLLVTARDGDHTLRMASVTQGSRRVPNILPRVGDAVEIGGGENPLEPYATLAVSEVEVLAPTRELAVTFSDALPDRCAAGDVAANSSAAPRARIRNCSVRNNRARGMLVQTRDVVVENCVFEHVSGAALHVASDANFWWEGIGVRDVAIRRNRFHHCNFGAARRGAAVDVFSELEGGSLSPAGVHRNIVIENNRFEESDGSAIHLHSTDGAVLRRNEFVNSRDVAILISRSRNVRVEKNTLAGEGGGLSLGPDCDETSLQILHNTGF